MTTEEVFPAGTKVRWVLNRDITGSVIAVGLFDGWVKVRCDDGKVRDFPPEELEFVNDCLATH